LNVLEYADDIVLIGKNDIEIKQLFVEIENIAKSPNRFTKKKANKTYFTLQEVFRNKNISKRLKLGPKNIIIYKTLTYVSENWILTERDRNQINIFERKVYRRI
jgi:hypothetical protein